MSTWTYMNIKGQGHSLTFDQGHSDSTFLNFFYLCLILYLNKFEWETARPIEAKFHVDPQWDWGTKVCSNGLGHMTKMTVMCIYGKNRKKVLLLSNQKADDLESWYAASGNWVLPILFKWWTWVDLDLFYEKVKFCTLCFCMGRR